MSKLLILIAFEKGYKMTATMFKTTDIFKNYAAAIGQLTIPNNMDKLIECLTNISGKIIVSGLGKSGLVGQKLAASLSSTGSCACFLHAAEAGHGDLGMLSAHDAVITLSHSGTSKECMWVVKRANRLGIPTIAITQSPLSPLAQASDFKLCYPFESEFGTEQLAPTTSTILMMSLADCITMSLASAKQMTPKTFAERHPAGQLGLRLTPVSAKMSQRSACPIVTPTCSIRNALLSVSSHNTGLALIVEGKKLLGVFSDGDFRRVMIKSQSLDDLIIDYATLNPTTITSHTSLYDALTLMRDKKITAIPVVDNDVLNGCLHIHQIKD